MLVGVIALVTATVLVAAFFAVRLANIDGNRHLASLLALLPHVTVVSAALTVLAVGLRWWPVGAVLVGLTLGLLCCVGVRLVPDRRSGGSGVALTVLAANLLHGRGDVKTVVELARRHDVDVLALIELTPECAEEFSRAGLADLLPHQVRRSDAGGRGGAAIVSRHPLTELSLVTGTTLVQPGARLDVAGLAVELVAVHPVPPTYSTRTWRSELGRLPGTGAGTAIRILAGDFNATVDHAAFRRVLRQGYVDAACARGAGLRPTWRLGRLPLVTIDHVLVDARAHVDSYRVFDVPGSDHRAVLARLRLPTVR